MNPGERDPLLQVHSVQARSTTEVVATVNQGEDPSKYGPMDISRTTRYGILAGIWAATFLSSLNSTLVTTLLPSISSEFNKSQQASWLGTAYLLATCTFTPLYGRLCNVMGRRGANQIAVFFAALGTAVCGLSTSMEMLIAARFLEGLGGGGVFTTASIITSDMYDLRSRGLTQGVAHVFNSLGMGLGGPFGGFISDKLGWRWAFFIQLPLFSLSFILTSINLRYATPGRGKNVKDVLKRIDYGGSFTLMAAVLSFLIFLSMRFSEEYPWSSPVVYASLLLSGIFTMAFLAIELFIASEPVLAPSILQQRVPVLVGMSNFLVATSNFSVWYNFPTWFQTVLLTSASEAGAHLIPNGISISCGSLFAGWIIHKTGNYKRLNLIFGLFPFVSAILLSIMREDSPPIQLWLSIIPLGFGNAVVLQTMLIALLAHLPNSAIAIGTGFGQLFRGIGQVGGVAISAALFQSVLNTQLHKRIHGQDAEETISLIRRSVTVVAQLPLDLQRAARDSYAVALRAVFILAACATFLAYLARLPIPDKSLDGGRPCSASRIDGAEQPSTSPEGPLEVTEGPQRPLGDVDEHNRGFNAPPRCRRLSIYGSTNTTALEGDYYNGSDRPSRRESEV